MLAGYNTVSGGAIRERFVSNLWHDVSMLAAAQYVVVRLVSVADDQEWPLAFFATLIQQVLRFHGAHVLMICGNPYDLSLPFKCVAQR